MVARFCFHRDRLFSGGANPSPTRHNKRDSKCAIPFAFCLKVFEGGAGGNVIFRLRNITVATERCDVFLQKVSPCILFIKFKPNASPSRPRWRGGAHVCALRCSCR